MLPIFQTDDKDLSLMQTQWASQLNPTLANPILNGHLLSNVLLANGPNTINHKLARKLIGWVVTGQNASATFYDLQTSNASPDKTLLLQASGAVTINIYVF